MARKILLADDSVTAQNMGRKILADAGYEVTTVNNGSAALKKIAEQKPDLIVLDVYMPGYSGLEVCQRLKEANETARIPVLLTVGKLEPFKPEEAKRARADGFIVKPFEASELLSALSKLEDKIVPRGEASKPGRFARATAALDEGRYDKTVAIDEDQGWKNRIQFPTKKEKPEQEEVDDSAIYNPVNKDLRTKFDAKASAQASKLESKAEVKAEPKVDLGALAPEGLPKDVTPEEIAALAAAAAQVKGAHVKETIVESTPSEIAPAKVSQEPAKQQSAEPVQPPKPEVQLETKVEPKSDVPVEAKREPKLEAKQPEPEKVEAVAKSAEPPAEAAAINLAAASEPPAPSPAEVMAAIAGLEPDSSSSSASTFASTSGNIPSTPAGDSGKASEPVNVKPAAEAAETDHEPVTMAQAPSAAQTPRWSAVAVAVSPEDAGLSLELEMQKAYAAFAAAESGHAASASTAAPTQESSAAVASPTPAPTQEPAASVPASTAPESVQDLTAVASAATDAITAAVRELEAKAAAYLTQTASADAERVPAAAAEKLEEKVESLSAVAPPIAVTPEHTYEASDTKADAVQANPLQPESRIESSIEAAASSPIEKVETEKIQDAPSSARTDEARAAEVLAATQSAASQPAENVPSVPEPVAKTAPVSKPSHESDISATTAAAWASWRQIRESASPKATSSEIESETQRPAQDAAMAVAAGAEKRPEDSASAQPNDEVASIVDSVLADLRPKIFEEISRKMGKK